MNTTNAAVSAGALAVVGRWSSDEDVDMRLVVAVVILALMLASLPEKIAQPLAYLILVAVLFKYGPAIIEKTGITKSASIAGKRKPRGVIPGHHFTRSGFRNPKATGATGVIV